MAANPKRKGMSTLPVYLPKVSAKRKRAAERNTAHNQLPCVYVEGGFDPSAAKSLAEELCKPGGLEASIEGEMISALPRGPQLALRHKVASAARGLAKARVCTGEPKHQPCVPLRGEVDQEESGLAARTHHNYTDKARLPSPADLSYDGELVQATFRELLPDPEKANIVVTSRSLTTWDENAEVWTTRAVVPGNPILVGRISEGTRADVASLAAEVRNAFVAGPRAD